MLRNLILAFALLVAGVMPAFAVCTTNSACFWVGGTGTWDNSDATHWSSTSGGAGGAGVPAGTSSVTFDGSSGGGTVTVNANVVMGTLTIGLFTGTIDFSANNNNVTVSAGSAAISLTGAGTKTLNMGNGTWTVTTTANGITVWDCTTCANLTLVPNGSTLLFNGNNGGNRIFAGGGKTYGIVTFADSASTAFGSTDVTGANTFATLNLTAPMWIRFPSGVTTTITNAAAWNGSSSAFLLMQTSTATGVQATVHLTAAGSTMSWIAIQNITFNTNSIAGTNCFDLKVNNFNGGSCIAPATGGGGGPIIIGALFKRDLMPAANDNSPMWIDIAA